MIASKLHDVSHWGYEMDTPSESESKLLQYIIQYLQEVDTILPRTNTWFAEKMNRSNNDITQYKGRLKKKGYLNKSNSMPTEKARKWIQQINDSMGEIKSFNLVKTVIGVYGQVVAGPLDPDNDGVHVILEELDNSAESVLTIPDSDRDIFALQVVGKSMENEGIFEGDYVIAERFHPWPVKEKPRHQDIIIAKYFDNVRFKGYEPF
jgi:SOS-response transcriptional repressor LexA